MEENNGYVYKEWLDLTEDKFFFYGEKEIIGIRCGEAAVCRRQ
jgi:hypothetical protein